MVATFWENFLFLIFLPLAMLWGFALVDLFRRDDIGGVSKTMSHGAYSAPDRTCVKGAR